VWFEWVQEYACRMIGLAVGFLLGIVYLFFGLFNMILFGLILYIGYYIGKKKDEQVDLKFVLAQILPDKFKMF
jgi:uncharacterized membrane protein